MESYTNKKTEYTCCIIALFETGGEPAALLGRKIQILVAISTIPLHCVELGGIKKGGSLFPIPGESIKVSTIVLHAAAERDKPAEISHLLRYILL